MLRQEEDEENEEKDNNVEEKPDLYHLDVGGGGQGPGHPAVQGEED